MSNIVSNVAHLIMNGVCMIASPEEGLTGYAETRSCPQRQMAILRTGHEFLVGRQGIGQGACMQGKEIDQVCSLTTQLATIS